MNAKWEPGDELVALLERLCVGDITPEQFDRLSNIIVSDAPSRRFYVRYLNMHANLPRVLHSSDDTAEDKPEYNSISALSLSPLPSPLSPSFVGGPVFSYMVATVVLCLMLLGAWAYKITHNSNDIATNSPRSTTSGPSALVFVGKITGMKDCRWSNKGVPTVVGASVLMNREYALASGLLEITYQSGARVILEGPCTYKVESSDGGYLELGKLTARIEERGEGRGESAKPQALFSVKTPTAIVTDLGTEFGIEVTENGDTTSYVFQGSISVQGLAASVASGATEKVLHENESIRVSRVRETHQDQTSTETVRFTHPTETPKFVRRLYTPPKYIDLLDIVAGGDGRGLRREKGIDPTTGMAEPFYQRGPLDGPKRYLAVSWNREIDGVFVPDGRDGPVQLDSAGHTCDMPATNGMTWGSIWARAADISERNEQLGKDDSGFWMYAMGRGDKFMPQGRGLLGFHANIGITFDLEAIRKHLSDVGPLGFHSSVGMIEGRFRTPVPTTNMADVWVFVDGRLRFSRKQMRPKDGVSEIDVELQPKKRFLTLVVTDSTGSSQCDWVVFGDPTITATEKSPEDGGN